MDQSNTKPYHLPADAVWFITGCSSGLGQSLAELVAKSSNRVVATARNPASLSYLPDAPNVLKLALDVTSIASIEAALAATLATFHRIDVVVNNAGYTLVGDTEAAGDKEARDIFDTNFWGLVDVTKRVLPIFRDENEKNGGQKGGVVLNISSVGGWNGYPGSSFYHATKFAVEGWTESVAKEMPTEWNIHLSLIEPGGVKTNYATTSLKEMATRHPAYSNPSYPTNVILAYKTDAKAREFWSDPEDIVKAMYQIVSRGQRIPIRVPLGGDAWSMIKADVDNMAKDLEEVKELSIGVGKPEQLATIEFLKRSN